MLLVADSGISSRICVADVRIASNVSSSKTFV